MIMLTREIEFKGHQITLRLDNQLKVFIKTSEIEPFIVIRKIDFIKSIKELPEYLDTDRNELALLLYNDSSFISFIYDKADEFKKDISVVDKSKLDWKIKISISNYLNTWDEVYSPELIDLYQTKEKLVYIDSDLLGYFSEQVKNDENFKDKMILVNRIPFIEDVAPDMETFGLEAQENFETWKLSHTKIMI